MNNFGGQKSGIDCLSHDRGFTRFKSPFTRVGGPHEGRSSGEDLRRLVDETRQVLRQWEAPDPRGTSTTKEKGREPISSLKGAPMVERSSTGNLEPETKKRDREVRCLRVEKGHRGFTYSANRSTNHSSLSTLSCYELVTETTMSRTAV